MLSKRLRANAFFAALVAAPPPLLTSAHKRRDIVVLVPVQGALVACSRLDVSSKAFADAHIIVPLPAHGSSSVPVHRSEFTRHFYSLSNKPVSLSGTSLCLYNDQYEIECETTVLDDLLFSEDGLHFVVYLIEQPLLSPKFTLGQKNSADPHDSVLLVANLLSQVNKDRHGQSVLDRINDFVRSFNDRVLEMANLEIVRNEMMDTLEKCFDTVRNIDSNSLKSICEEADIALSDLFQLTEAYVMENTYELTYFLISKEFRKQDIEISNAVSQMQSLDFSQLGVSNNFGKSVMSAVKLFRMLPSLRTPSEKIKCLMDCIHSLKSKSVSSHQKPLPSSSPEMVLSSDELVPLMVLIVIRSNIQNLSSSLNYMQNFSFEQDVVGGEFGFALSTLEAVIAFVRENALSFSETCTENLRLWQAVTDGDIVVLDEFFKEEPADHVRAVDIRNHEGDGILHLACRSKNALVAEFCMSHIRVVSSDILPVLKKGISPNDTNYLLETPLHIAASMGDSLSIQLLLGKSGSSDRDFQGNTPFMRACETTCVEAITLLKPQEEDIEACINSLGLTPFHICTDHRILKTLVDILHPTATMMNFPSYNERLTPLLYHAGKGNTEICESIVCSGLADLHANDLAGRSVLHLSAFRINERLVQTVLDADSSVSGIVSLRGNTCLHAIAAAASIAEVFDEKSVLAIIKAV
ncbi:hypothetical protein HDU82_001346, partial [Entophlyctis luteolus]